MIPAHFQYLEQQLRTNIDKNMIDLGKYITRAVIRHIIQMFEQLNFDLESLPYLYLAEYLWICFFEVISDFYLFMCKIRVPLLDA